MLSPTVVSRVWDVVFTRLRFGEEQAWHVMYKVLLVVFRQLSPMLLESGLEESLRVLWDLENQRPDVFSMHVGDLFRDWDAADEFMPPPLESPPPQIRAWPVLCHLQKVLSKKRVLVLAYPLICLPYTK